MWTTRPGAALLPLLVAVVMQVQVGLSQAACPPASFTKMTEVNIASITTTNGETTVTPTDPAAVFKVVYEVSPKETSTFQRVTYRLLGGTAGRIKIQVFNHPDQTINGSAADTTFTVGENKVLEFSSSTYGNRIRFTVKPRPGTTSIQLVIVGIEACQGIIDTTTTTTTTTAPYIACPPASFTKTTEVNIASITTTNGETTVTPTDPAAVFKVVYEVSPKETSTFQRVTYRLLGDTADRINIQVFNHPDHTVNGSEADTTFTVGENKVLEFSSLAFGNRIRFTVIPKPGTTSIQLVIVGIEACAGIIDTTTTTSTTTTTTTTTTIAPCTDNRTISDDALAQWIWKSKFQKPNVLFVVVDDFRPWLGSYGEEFMITPNMDLLASKSVRFDSAYVQHAICGPSRASFMTGRRSDTTHVMTLQAYWRTVGGNFTTVSQYFKQNGYLADGVGKIFHNGSSGGGTEDYPYSWSVVPDRAWPTWEPPNKHATADRPVEEVEGKLHDTLIAEEAISRLQQYSQNPNQPFFLAVGFQKPHLPFMYPEQYADLYPDPQVAGLAQHRDLQSQSLHKFVYTTFGELRNYEDIQALNLSDANNWRVPDAKQYELRRGYAIVTSYVDAMVGRVLQALSDYGLANNTIISFISDHGFQLGEVGQWCKHNNYETSVRIPMMVRVPGVTDNDGFQSIDLFNYTPQNYGNTPSTKRPVELVDLYPTLAELAGLAVPPMCPLDSSNIETCVEGASLVPLIREAALGASVVWKDVAFSQYPRGKTGKRWMGYTLRTRQYRYNEWVSYNYDTYEADFSNVEFKQLYLHDINLDGGDLDPEEAFNVVDDQAFTDVVAELAQKLRENWFTTLENYYSQTQD